MKCSDVGNLSMAVNPSAAPAGLGRTRFFLRYARSVAPWLHPPRWLFHVLINGFLDQACKPCRVAVVVSCNPVGALVASCQLGCVIRMHTVKSA